MMQKENIAICWLYSDLLDLYGDWGNLLVLTKRLEQLGIASEITRLSISDQLDFTAYDMVYIGPGKARNLKKAAEHFSAYREAVSSAIENGKVFLITGNARLLFGTEYQYCQENGNPVVIKGVGYFSYTGVETGEVFISDLISQPLCGENRAPVYGFVNRTSYILNNSGPYLFQVLQGAGEENQKGDFEGNHCHNFFATWQLGPVLVKNPHLTKEVLSRLLPGIDLNYDDKLAVEAWKRTMDEFPTGVSQIR